MTEAPTTVIHSRWRYLFDVTSVLVAREFKSRYQQTSLGAAWSVLNPLLFLATFYIMFKVVLDLGIPNYASFVFLGIVSWNWFQGSLTEAVTGISNNAGLVGQPRFPLAVMPVVSVTTALINFLTAMPLVLIVILIEGARPDLSWFALPILMVVQYVLTLALAYAVAAFNVHFRDTQYILPAIVQIAYFMTPIFYQAKQIPPAFAPLFNFNPMFHLLGAYRKVLLEGYLPDWKPIGVVFVVGVVLLIAAQRYFKHASYRFLEEL